jgi:CheY-like chemotaxis protein
VLLIDDDAVDVKTVQRAFKKNAVQFDLSVAGNGEEGLELLRSGSVDLSQLLILLDLNMPRMGGLEFLEHLRNDPDLRTLPVVVLTTSDEEKDRVAAYDKFVAGYIVKPVTYEKFVDVVRRLADYWAMVQLA